MRVDPPQTHASLLSTTRIELMKLFHRHFLRLLFAASRGDCRLRGDANSAVLVAGVPKWEKREVLFPAAVFAFLWLFFLILNILAACWPFYEVLVRI